MRYLAVTFLANVSYNMKAFSFLALVTSQHQKNTAKLEQVETVLYYPLVMNRPIFFLRYDLFVFIVSISNLHNVKTNFKAS